MGRRRAQAPRLRRADRLRHRAEDRRARDQPHLRGRHPCARRNARRRAPGRGRDRQPAHDPVGPAQDARRRPARGRGGARRGLHADLRLPRAERARRGTGPEARAEPAQRRRRLAPPEGLVDHGLAPARGLDVRPRRRGSPRPDDALGSARVAPRARLSHEPVRRAARLDRVRRRGLPRLGDEAHRARLRDRRDRDQGRLVRPAATAERAPRPPPLGARLQVGADDRADKTPANPHQSGADRRAQPVGAAGAGRGRRRDRLDRDAPQRGRHQPQGHPRRRHGHRPARRRRDPAGRRAGAPAREGLAPFSDAQEVPALRRRDRPARGRGDAPLPEPEVRVARARDAHQLGLGHRRRRRAGDPEAVARRDRDVAARPLPPDEGTADGARRLRGDLGRQRRRGDRAVEAGR